MSENNFELYQEEVCKGIPEAPPIKKICPTCVPNKSYVAPDWRNLVEEPFLNEAQCEYQICVTINNEGDSFSALEFRNSVGEGKKYATREQLLFSFVQPAIVLVLEELDKLVATQIICASHNGPAVSGYTAEELISKYNNFDGAFEDLKDDPLNKMEKCKSFFRAKEEVVPFEPSKPFNFTQMVLRNRKAEVTNPFALELYARVVEFDIDPIQNLLKVLVSIPAFIIEQVPNTPSASEIQQAAESTVDEVELKVEELFGQVSRLRFALSSYSKYQSFFYQTQDGFLRFKDDKKDYYASKYSKKVKNFYEDLKKLGKNKKWNFKSNVPSLIRKNADRIRITFSGGTDRPYAIKKVEAKIEGCDYQKIAGKNNRIIKKWSKDQTTLNYFAKIREIDTALRARESYPWLDFLVKFTYPLITVNYGTLNEQNIKDSMGECVQNNINEFGGELKDYILNEALSLAESLAYEFNSKSNCSELLSDDAIEKKYLQKDLNAGLDARKKVEEEFSERETVLGAEKKLVAKKEVRKQIRSEMSEIRNRIEFEFKASVNSGSSLNLTISQEIELEQLKNSLSGLDEQLTAVEDEIEELKIKANSTKQERRFEKKIPRQLKRIEAKEARKKNHPYFKEAKRLALEEIKTQDTLLSNLVDLETFISTGELNFKSFKNSDPKDVISRMTLCNFKSLTIGAIRCLFSGVSQEAAFKKVAESALRAMDVDVFGMFINGLPPDKQSEIRGKIRSEIGEMPMPWEEGFKEGNAKEANPYLNYLSSVDKDNSVKAKREEITSVIEILNNEKKNKDFDIKMKNGAIKEIQEELALEIPEEDRYEKNSKIASLRYEIGTIEREKGLLDLEIEKMQKELSNFPDVDFKDLPEDRKKELIEAQNNAQGTFGTTAGNIQEVIVDAWIEQIFDIMEVDAILSILDRFPGGQLVQRYINKVGCSYQGLFNPPLKSFLSTLSFDPCGEGSLGLSFPERTKIPKLPKLYNKSFLTLLRNKFIEKLETVLTQIILRSILKLIEVVDGALCKSLNAVSNFAASKIAGKSSGLDDAFRDAFCPDSNEDELNNIKDDTFNRALGKPKSTSDNSQYDCLFSALNGILSKQEVIGLMTNTPSNMDESVLRRISEIVKARCPEFADVFGETEDIADAFGSIGNLITPELREFLRDQAETQPEGPIFDSICLTQEELDKWNNDRRQLLTDNGLDEETANDLIDKANERALNDLGSVSDMLQKGPEGLLAEALDDLLNQDDPACEVNPSAVILEDEELSVEKLDMLNDFFKNIERKFLDDLMGGRKSLLNNILIDTHGFRLKKHERSDNRQLLFPNFVSSDEDWENEKENFPFQIEAFGGFPYKEEWKKGMFPETVGHSMLNQIKELSTKIENDRIVLKFADIQEDPDYESEVVIKIRKRAKPTYKLEVNEVFHRRISRKEAKKLDIDRKSFGGSTKNNGATDLTIRNYDFKDYTESIDYELYEDRYGIEVVLLKILLSKKSGATIRNSSLGKLSKVFEKWNSKVFETVRNSVIKSPSGDIPTGFLFGADTQQSIKFEDLLYVNPEADPEDKKTWIYTKLPSEKVLGKSATENPRVHFLDPAVHGGSYLFPKVYIEPATYNGWMGMVKTFIPEMELCEDSDNGFLQIMEISKRAKKVENSLPMDKRLSHAPECRFEVPYDRQLTPANHGLLEGIVTATVRTYTTDYVVRSMPIFSSIEFSAENYDNSTFLNMIQRMEKEMSAFRRIEPNVIKGYAYYLLFLEQSAQVVQRQVKEGLIKETPEIKRAFKNIAKAQRTFRPLNFNDPVVLDEIAKGSSIAGFGTEWREQYRREGVIAKLRKLVRLLSPFKVSLARKLAVIHDTKEHAELLLSALVKKEIDSLVKRLGTNMRPRAHVYDLKKYLLSKNGILKFSDIRSGESIVETETVEGGSKPFYGTIRDCPSKNLTPLNMEIPEEGVMFLEKFVRVIQKDDTEEVMTVQEFQRMLNDRAYSNKNLKISDYFGNATLLNKRVVGTIGVKMGVRLIYVPHSSLGISPTLEQNKERVGLIGNNAHIPLASYENDIIDRKIKDIDFSKDNFGEDIKCYVDKLAMEEDFKLIFEAILKPSMFASSLAIYSFYNFFESIGIEEVEEDRRDNVRKEWKRLVFEDTKDLLKKQFRSIYRLDDDDIKEDNRREKRKFDAQFVSNLLPSSYLGLDSSLRWWQKLGIVSENPFDPSGEECLSDFQKIFKD